MAGDTKPINHLEKMFVDPEGTEPINHLEKIIKENIGGGGGGGAVNSVNGKTGNVVLTADDIDAQNSQSIQDNLERIDDELGIRQVTINITDFPDNLTEDFLYRVDTEFEHDSKTYTVGLYQVVDDDLVKISPVELLTTTGQSTTAGMTQKAITDALANAGGIKVLTAADYNWNTSGGRYEPYDCVAPFLLDKGIYQVPSSGIKVALSNLDIINNQFMTLFVSDKFYAPFECRRVIVIQKDVQIASYLVALNDGSIIKKENYLTVQQVVDNLTSTSNDVPLSANQGKVLKDLVDSLVISGSGAPTTSTVGTVGKLYEDTTNGDLYQCTAVSGSTYTWEAVGGGGVTPVQNAGTSTTDVMSQDAVTKMVFPNYENLIPSIAIGKTSISSDSSNSIAIGNYAHATASYAIAIGQSTANRYGSVAIGNQANATAKGAIALGADSHATVQGQFDIGVENNPSIYGYNGTNYRLLTGLHDPVSDHDAATKGYVDALITQIQALEARIAALEGNA